MLINAILIILALFLLSILSDHTKLLKKIHRKEKKIMANQQALDAVVAALTSTVADFGASVDRLVVDFAALKDKLDNLPPAPVS